MSKKGKDYDAEMEAARNANPKGLQGSKWKTPTKGDKRETLNNHVTYTHRSLLGGEQVFRDGEAKRASRYMK